MRNDLFDDQTVAIDQTTRYNHEIKFTSWYTMALQVHRFKWIVRMLYSLTVNSPVFHATSPFQSNRGQGNWIAILTPIFDCFMSDRILAEQKFIPVVCNP